MIGTRVRSAFDTVKDLWTYKFGAGDFPSPGDAAPPQTLVAAQDARGLPHSPHGPETPVLPAPRRMRVFTVQVVVRGINVCVTGPAESEWQAGDILARRWPDARIVAIREGQV